MDDRLERLMYALGLDNQRGRGVYAGILLIGSIATGCRYLGLQRENPNNIPTTTSRRWDFPVTDENGIKKLCLTDFFYSKDINKFPGVSPDSANHLSCRPRRNP